jgi:hypothetical protein
MWKAALKRRAKIGDARVSLGTLTPSPRLTEQEVILLTCVRVRPFHWDGIAIAGNDGDPVNTELWSAKRVPGFQ